jgi:2-dehydro-3-deoxygalactonokinase
LAGQKGRTWGNEGEDLMGKSAPAWIAVDWGTSNLRAWAMGPEGVLDHAESDRGMGKLRPEEFEAALLDTVQPWLGAGPVLVLACGMVGAKQGWREAKYRAVPCSPTDPAGLIAVATTDARLDVRIAPGLSQDKPADVMRGEETQIAGALALYPKFDGVLCLPGTHAKWAHISAGEVVSFQTYMTGEMFALLSGQSVLRHSMGEGWDDAAFDSGLSDALSRPDRIAAQLFSLRAQSLLHGLPGAAAKSRLSGLLIGIELAGAKPYWLGQDVKLIGATALAASYARALQSQGVTADVLDATACTLAGLSRLYLQLKGH